MSSCPSGSKRTVSRSQELKSEFGHHLGAACRRRCGAANFQGCGAVNNVIGLTMVVIAVAAVVIAYAYGT
jgi:hypothetical protein